ncbi:MAG: sugar ABC transporter permease [Trueperaceae bacterium]|nr:MAG: sugar ABC transporter permease [Trueperaceae bacterium]
MRRNSRLKYLFLLPAVFWVLGFTIYPLLYSLRLSLFRVNIGRPDIFLGFGNFARAFTDANVLNAAKVTLTFVAGGVAIELVLGLLFALLYNQKLPARNALRTIMTLPLFATPVGIGYLFVTIFHEEGGLIKNLIGLKVPWLSDPNWAIVSVMLVDVWKWTPFVFVVLLAALQSIPEEYYEAARLETTSFLELFRYITFPLLQPTIILVIVLRVAEAFKVFDIPFSLTNGGPGTSTETFTMLAYNTYRRFGDFGYGSALAYLLLIVVLLVVLMFFRRIRQAYT